MPGHEVGVMLAETVAIDGDLIAIILIVLVILAAAAVALVVSGFVLAIKAARGSSNALTGWVVVATLEGLLGLASLPTLVRGQIHIFVIFVVALAAQVLLYLTTKSARR